MEIIHGPTIPATGGGVIYQITLASGMIITSPSAFGANEHEIAVPKTVVTKDGRVLIIPMEENRDSLIC